MAIECVVAIDIGTQSSRVALVDVSGHIRDLASRPIELFTPRPGWAEQDPEQWWATTVANLEDVVGRNSNVSIRAIGVSAQMHSLVPLDSQGATTTPRSAIWSDKRNLDQVEAIIRRPDIDALARIAGNRPLPAWSGFKMAWLRANVKGAYDRAASLLVAKDFINLRLCGERATDPSEASGSFLCDATTGQWSQVLLDALGVDRRKLPDIVGSASIIGHVREEIAASTGLKTGTPVVAGSGDMMCQLLSSGITRRGRVAVIAGTASIVAVAAEAASSDANIMNLRAASDTWIQFGISDAAGKASGWFIDCFDDRKSGVAADVGPTGVGVLDLEAAQIEPGSDGLLFFPYLLGERTLGSPLSRASFVGATLSHGRGHFARAVMEGITFEDRRALECLRAEEFDGPIRCSAGGANSALWNQIRADIFAHPVQAGSETEGGIRGAAILAGVGAGWYSDPAAGADEVAQSAETWRPAPEAVKVYEHEFRTFCAVHDALDGLWPMWPRSAT